MLISLLLGYAGKKCIFETEYDATFRFHVIGNKKNTELETLITFQLSISLLACRATEVLRVYDNQRKTARVQIYQNRC